MKKLLTFTLIAALLLACMPVMADEYTDMLSNAETYCASGDYAKAIASYQLAQKLQPDNIQAFLGEANVQIILEDYASATSAINAALRINPVSPDVWYLKCKVDVLLNDVAAFEQDIIFAKVSRANLTDIYLTAASIYLSSGYYDQAVNYFAKADLSSFSDIQREQYRKALMLSGNRETADELGLTDQSVRNAALDAAFDRGDLTLTKAELPTVAAEDFEFPDVIWDVYEEEKPEDPVATFNAYLADTEIAWLSLSPTGNSGILRTDDCVICCYEGKYHILYPSKERGVKDVHGNLKTVSLRSPRASIAEEGVVYSPDGRYAAMTDNRIALANAQFIFDPIIIDLSTGEMILTATYENSIMKDGAGVVTTATFSADGQYFYYMLYGNTTRHHSALYRCNLQNGKTELCYSGNDTNYNPNLSETAYGAFIILRDTIKLNEVAGITSISYKNGAWQGKEYSFDLPRKHWDCRRLMQSANSGYAFATGRSDSLSLYAFQRIRPDDDFEGLNQYYAISKETGQIQAYSAKEITSLFSSLPDIPSREDISNLWLDVPFQIILTSTLSPDGHYVLLNTSNYGSRDNPEISRHLYLLRLDDLAIKEVGGIDPSLILAGDQAIYRPVIEWNTDTLIIDTKEGTQAYQFKLQ